MKEKIKVYLARFWEWVRPYLFFGSDLAEPIKTHIKKCDMELYKNLQMDIEEGGSTFFITKSDQQYEPGDDILFKEYDERLEEITGREIRVTIFCIEDKNEGLKPGYCVLGLEAAY